MGLNGVEMDLLSFLFFVFSFFRWLDYEIPKRRNANLFYILQIKEFLCARKTA